jgi:hypothetical protein
MPPARCSSAAVEASRRPGILPETAGMSGWDRGLRLVALLVARAPSTRPFGAVDAAGLREALRQTAGEEYGSSRQWHCSLSAGCPHLARRLSSPPLKCMRECTQLVKAEQPRNLGYM